MRLESVRCPLCGADDKRTLYPATRGFDPDAHCFSCTSPQLGNHGGIVRCRRCSMVFADPQPDHQALLEAYRSVEDPQYLEETAGRTATFTRSLTGISEFLNPPGRLLDVGCYTGEFLRQALSAGWAVTGIELSRWAAGHARKWASVFECELTDLPLSGGPFDVISMWDVVEHVRTPTDLLTGAHRLLRPGGLLALSTHMLDSLPARLLGRRYPFLMGMHLCHFTRRTLRRLLDESGFQVMSIRAHVRFVRLHYFLDRAGHALGWPRPFEMLGRARWTNHRLIRVSWLGLVNVFAARR